MPAVPKRKLTRSRTRRRRARWTLSKPHLVECPQCHEPKLPHRVCPNCGYYRGRKIVTV